MAMRSFREHPVLLNTGMRISLFLLLLLPVLVLLWAGEAFCAGHKPWLPQRQEPNFFLEEMKLWIRFLGPLLLPACCFLVAAGLDIYISRRREYTVRRHAKISRVLKIAGGALIFVTMLVAWLFLADPDHFLGTATFGAFVFWSLLGIVLGVGLTGFALMRRFWYAWWGLYLLGVIIARSNGWMGGWIFALSLPCVGYVLIYGFIGLGSIGVDKIVPRFAKEFDEESEEPGPGWFEGEEQAPEPEKKTSGESSAARPVFVNPYIPNRLRAWCKKCKAHTPVYMHSKPVEFHATGMDRGETRCRQCDGWSDAPQWRRMGCGCFAGGGFAVLIPALGVLFSGGIPEDEIGSFVGLLVLGVVPFIVLGLWIGNKVRGFSAWEREQNSKSPAELKEQNKNNPIELNFPSEDFETRITYGDWRDYEDADSGIEKFFGDLNRKLSGGEETRPEEPLPAAENLEGADLADADMQGADLRESNLKEANLQGADLRGADLRNANLTGADLKGANLQGADLNFADFSKVNIEGADLRGAKGWRSFFSGAVGTAAHLPGDPLDE